MSGIGPASSEQLVVTNGEVRVTERQEPWALRSASHLPSRLVGNIAVDLETFDPGLKNHGPGWFCENGRVLGIAIQSDNFSSYIPIGHESGNVDKQNVINWFQEVVAPHRCIYANAQYDYGWLRTLGIYLKIAPHDILVQAPVLNEHSFSYSLDSLREEFIPSMSKKKGNLIEMAAGELGIKPKDAMGNLHRLPLELVAEYAVHDVVLTKALFERLAPDIEREELTSTYELETGLIPMLVEMRARGVRVDLDRAEQMSEKYKKMEQDALDLIKHETGYVIEKYFAAKQIAPVLDHYQVKYPTTPKTGAPSIDSALLEANRNIPAINALHTLRKFNKARTTFVEGFILGMSVNGRLHGNFNPLKSDEGGTISGRFSSSQPNLQQIPARDKIIGPDVRSLFLPEVDCLWGSLDYSQQEPRHCVSMAFKMGFPSAALMRKQFIEDPTTDFHDANTRLTGLDKIYGFEAGRKKAKNVGLGLMYSMGGAKLCHSLGLPTVFETASWAGGRLVEMPGEEGARILKMFHDGAPYIKQLSKACQRAAKERGWIKTPMGRKFRFPYRGASEGHYKAHKALNSLVQGLSADEMKNAMLNMYKEGFLPGLTVHDEVDIVNIDTPEGFRRPVEIMIESLAMPVPSKVDLEVGPNWGSIEKVDLPGLPFLYTET